MKRSLMLMCAYGNTNATYNLRNNCTFADLDDVDMENLVRLARTFSLEHVCVVIEQCGEAISVGAESEQCYMQDTTLYNLVVNGELRVDDDVDLLPEFYLHRDKVPMTKLWAQGYIKNDSVWVTAVCSMLEDKGCSYGVSIWTSNNPRVGSDMISDIVASHVWAKPLTRPTDVVLDLKDNYGLDVSYHVTWLGVEKAQGELYGAHSISFDQLRSYRKAVTQYNPRSYVDIDYDEHNYCFR
ncbi:hypothetical protein ACSBR2_026350 [Camellia fascicularis]